MPTHRLGVTLRRWLWKFVSLPCCAPPLTAPALSTPPAPPSGRCSPTSSSTYPGLKGQLIDDSGSLHKFVNVYVNDDDIRYLDQLDTKVGEGDSISILPAVAGG